MEQYRKILRISNKVNVYSQAFKNEFEVFCSFGFKIYWCANFTNFQGDRDEVPAEMINISISNSFLSSANKKALAAIRRVINDENIDAIYCSTPIGGTLGRIASKKFKNVKVIYAAHGFLFFKGNSFIKNLLFIAHEKSLSKHTDCLLTITKEDFDASLKYNLCDPDHTYLIHGAGINTNISLEKSNLDFRCANGLSKDDFLIVSAGFLNTNKNNKVIIKALSRINNQSIKYIICGEGKEKERLQQLVKKFHLENRVLFLGYRTDIFNIMSSCDAFAMPSFREGLPRALLEAMTLGLPCLGSNTRGIKELIGDFNPGFLCNPRDDKAFALAIQNIATMSEEERLKVGSRNIERAKSFSNEIVKSEIHNIFLREFE